VCRHIIQIIAGLLLALKNDFDATPDDWDTTPPILGGCSVGSIIEASANNFRHHDEWIKAITFDSRQLKSIRALQQAFEGRFDLVRATDFRRNICPETLEILSNSSFRELTSNVLTFANNLAKRVHEADSTARPKVT
jgi:hypothetical protein